MRSNSWPGIHLVRDPLAFDVIQEKACAFCGETGRLTNEHVFGDWLSRIGLEIGVCRAGAGPLNRGARDLGSGRPFDRKVKKVCAGCNNGWMSALESTAGQVLSPLILGQEGRISRDDAKGIAAWIQKTALVGMLVSSDSARAGGYGLPQSEYSSLYTLRCEGGLLPNSCYWLGRYNGRQRVSSIWVTPLVVQSGTPFEADFPHAYATTVVLGCVVFHGVRFTSAPHEIGVAAPAGFVKIWPDGSAADLSFDRAVDDVRFIGLSKGLELTPEAAGMSLSPWRPAVDLERSTIVGSLVRLPAPCGEHFVFYPVDLARAGAIGEEMFFMTSCECGKAYLVETQGDGVHFKLAGTAEDVSAEYEEIVGEEYVIRDSAGEFVFKRIRHTSRPQ